MNSERWLPVIGYEGRYEVSDQGRLRALFDHPAHGLAPRILRPTVNPEGYRRMTLTAADTSRKNHFVHALVLTAFRGIRPLGLICRHLDGQPSNNSLPNLVWGTHAENCADAKRHGRHASRERHGGAKLTEDQVAAIRRLATDGVLLHREIGTLFGVHVGTISSIVRNLSWPVRVEVSNGQ